MTFELSFIFVLLVFNAFFALSEMAIVSASKPILCLGSAGKGISFVGLTEKR